MLESLRIRNLALVTDLTLDLGPGYNAISGETGAGKSILIGALNLVLGERADRTLIRAEADQCTVEATFDIAQLDAPLPGFLEEHGLESCEENQLLLKRTFSTAGSNRQFVNGSATTLAVLKRIGEWLVDMHGPHDHQSLLHPARQLAILDAFGGLQQPRAAFTTLLQRRTEIEQTKADLVVDEATYAQQLDLLRFQVKEINGAALDPDEEENLEADYQRSSNAARLLELCQGALQLVSENEESLLDRSGDLGRVLSDLQQVDDSAAGLVELHEEARANLQELQSALTVYADRVDIDPAQLASLEERVNLAQSLKRKYGGSIEAVNAFGAEAAQKLATLESRDEELARLNAELDVLESNLMQAGQAFRPTAETHPQADRGRYRASQRPRLCPKPARCRAQFHRSPRRGQGLRAGHRGVSIRAQPRRTRPAFARHCLLRRTRPRDAGAQDCARRRRFHSRFDLRRSRRQCRRRNRPCRRRSHAADFRSTSGPLHHPPSTGCGRGTDALRRQQSRHRRPHRIQHPTID